MSKIFEALEMARRAKTKKVEEALPAAPTVPASHPEAHEKAASHGKSTVARELIAIADPTSDIAEQFRFLRAMILRPPVGDPPRTVLVTSAWAGEGKTFVACNLAAAISQGVEEHVLLIDTDLRNSRAHALFQLPYPAEGLSKYLRNNIPLSNVLIKTCVEKLTILPGGNSTSRPSELLSSEKMRVLIGEVRDRYSDRYVVIDSPPMELAPETAVLCNEVDTVILVVRHGMAPRHSVQRVLEKIPRQKLLGVIFNAYERPLKLYGKYGYYNYGYAKKAQ